ncbi:hypothetical protein BU17DRAFT_43373, partial [Hysterangium stoloniferum]
TPAIHAINVFYISGLTFDIFSACLAYLTSRWFQRLTKAEKELLQTVFVAREKERSDVKICIPEPEESWERDKDGPLRSMKLGGLDRIFITWYSISLFAPVVFLVLGIACMVAGLYTYTWSQQTLIVAILASIAGLSTLPFILGVFAIGREPEKRRKIIFQLSRMQGDW